MGWGPVWRDEGRGRQDLGSVGSSAGGIAWRVRRGEAPTSGAVHSGVPAWLLVDIQVVRRARESPKSQTCWAARVPGADIGVWRGVS